MIEYEFHRQITLSSLLITFPYQQRTIIRTAVIQPDVACNQNQDRRGRIISILEIMEGALMKSGRVKSSSAKPRSRLGCNGCKKQRYKCDELKPTCTRCEKRSIPCVYSFEMIFQNQQLAFNKKSVVIKDAELMRKTRSVPRKDDSIASRGQGPLKEPVKSKDIDDKALPTTNNVVCELDQGLINGEGSTSEDAVKMKRAHSVVSFIPLCEEPLVPLPDDLLERPYFRDAFDFFLHFTGHFIVAASPQLYINNPFQVIIPQYATQNKCLLDLLISYALTHRSMVLMDENYSTNLVELLISRGLYRLFSLSPYDIKPEVSCVTALLLCVQKIFTGNEIEKYKEVIDLARSSFNTFIDNDDTVVKLPNGKRVLSEERNPFAYFLVTWIGYLEIIGMMMAISPMNYKMPYRPNSVFEKIQLERKSKIDLFLGFDMNFLVVFDKLIPILSMVEERESIEHDKVSTDILSKGVEWEFEFNTVYKAFKAATKDPQDLTESDPTLCAMNEIFYYAGIVHLYRRVYKIPRSNSIVQKMVGRIYKIVKREIDSATNAENCAVFPLFVAACESITEEHRAFFYDRFNIQFLGGNIPAGDVLKILEHTWNTGESWMKSVQVVREETGFFLI